MQYDIKKWDANRNAFVVIGSETCKTRAIALARRLSKGIAGTLESIWVMRGDNHIAKVNAKTGRVSHFYVY